MKIRLTVLASMLAVSCTQIPEYPGIYALDQGKLLNLSFADPTEMRDLSPNTEFIYFGEGANSIINPQLSRLKFVRNQVSGPLTSGIKISPIEKWFLFELDKQYARQDQSPQTINLFAHPVKGHPDMVRLVSLNPLPPGVYGLQPAGTQLMGGFSIKKKDTPKELYDEWISVSWYTRYSNHRPAAELDLVLWNNARTEARKLATQGNREEATKKCEEAKAISIPDGFVPKASKVKFEQLDCKKEIDGAWGAGRLIAAKQSFYARKYDDALQACEESLSAVPDNADAQKLKDQILAVKSALGR